METPAVWIGFNLFVCFLLALDLGVFHKKTHEVSVKEALIWSGVWITLAMIFNAGLYYFRGSEFAMQFLVGYVIEKSLSLDNIFVFLMIFSYFKVPALYQHKILFWGIIGALLMRAGLIMAGAKLIQEFHWVIYIFGTLLILTGVKMLVKKNESLHPDQNPLVKAFKKLMPVTENYEKDQFFVRRGSTWFATPLFIVLLVVETTDLIFAVDSIPAIFAVTDNPFIVYTSNVFAMLGLRSLYFALAGIMGLFKYLKVGLSVVLMFVGTKMMIVDLYKIPIAASLTVIVSIITLSILASVVEEKWKKSKLSL